MNKIILMIPCLINSICLNELNLENEQEVKCDCDFIENGYYFNFKLINTTEKINTFKLYLDTQLLFESGKTTDKQLSYSLIRNTGLLEYSGYKNLKLSVYFTDTNEIIEKDYKVLGLKVLDEQYYKDSFNCIYVYDGDYPILFDNFEIIENENISFPIDVKFRLSNFISLYVNEDLESKLTYKMSIDNKEYKLKSRYNKSLKKFDLSSDEIVFKSNPGIHNSTLTIIYDRFFPTIINYDYQCLLKRIVSYGDFSNFKIEFGEK